MSDLLFRQSRSFREEQMRIAERERQAQEALEAIRKARDTEHARPNTRTESTESEEKAA